MIVDALARKTASPTGRGGGRWHSRSAARGLDAEAPGASDALDSLPVGADHIDNIIMTHYFVIWPGAL